MIPALLLAGLGIAFPQVEEEPEFELSLPTRSDEAAWEDAGFRIGLGYSYGELFPLARAPRTNVHSAVLRLGAQLDQDWSLLGTLSYGAFGGTRGGMRFAATVEPTLRLVEGLRFGIGLGLGGIIMPETGVFSELNTDALNASYTYQDRQSLIPSCSGKGAMGLLRLEYLFVMGTIFGMGPSLQADAQWTTCKDSTHRTNPDTGEAIELRQQWGHYGLSLSWLFWWR